VLLRGLKSEQFTAYTAGFSTKLRSTDDNLARRIWRAAMRRVRESDILKAIIRGKIFVERDSQT
jgi:hypothetical protein